MKLARLLAVVVGLDIGCAAANRPYRAAIPAAEQTVEWQVHGRLGFCPATVEAIVRVREPGPEWECVAENYNWGDGRSAHSSCDLGDRALRVYSARHVYPRSGLYVLVIEFVGVKAGKVKTLFRQEVPIEISGGLAC